MIEIKINYGVDIDVEAPALRRMAAALLVLAGDSATTVSASSSGQGVHVTRDEPKTPFPVIVGGPVQGNGVQGWKIAPNDVPDVGADVAQARAEDDGPLVELDPATVFGAGNVAAASGSASSPSNVSIGAVLPPASSSTTGSTAAVGESGNGQGATSVTPSGTPAAPSNGAVTGGVPVDSRGLPWDVRIHAGTKTTNKDLTWKKKPNVDPALIAQVETELRAIMNLPAGVRVDIAPPPNAATGAPATPPGNVVPPPPPASAPGNVPAPPIPTPPPSPATTAGAVASSITGFHQLLPAVTNAIANGTLTEQRVADVLAHYGVAVLPQLAPRADLVALVAAALFPVQ